MHSTDLTIDLRSSLQRRLRVGAWVVLAVLGIAGAGAAVLDANRSATPVPVPVYDIEATSGDHTASLLNLGLGQPGVPQAPVPVDVDGDLLPDITVAVNLVNAEGLLNNPPDTGEVTAPNVEITRLETATLLARKSPPVRVNVKFTVTDIEGEEPDTVVRFGYDTGEGGSIPQEFKALVGGLDQFFNPIEAVIDTTGGPLGLDPGVQDLGLAPASSSYEGPLTIVAGLESGDTEADIDLEYSPFPEAVRVTFGWDDTGQHLTYAHDRFDEIDLHTDVDFVTGDQTIDFDAAIDRLPRSMAIDLFQDGTRGAIDYQARADERLPDIRADLRMGTPDGPPLNAAVDVEDLPRQMHAGWDTAIPEAEFTGSGNGVGAIEARIATFDGDPTVVDEFVPDEQQYATLELAPGGVEGDELLAAARLERIRSVTFRQDGEGIEAAVSTGDGQLPLQLHGDLDLRPSGDPHLTATATIAPLPDDVVVSVQPAGGGASDQPFRVTYDASSPVDIDTEAVLVEAGAAGTACGDAGTLCADLAVRHVPSHLQARVLEVSELEHRVEVDADGEPGAAKPDLDAHVVIGQDDGVPLVADAAIDGLARDLRIRTIQGADETLEKFEFHTCDRVYAPDPVDDACEPGTEDEIGLVQFSIANFLERPADLPAPKAVAPNHATVTGRGTTVDGDDVVRFEATGRIESIEKVQYVNSADIFGISSTIGDDQDLEVDVDLADIDFQGDDPANGRVDVTANAVVSPLPDDITFCFADAGRALTGPTDPVTAECEDVDPFGDGVSPAEGPMVVAYRANQPFDLDFDADLHLEGPDGGTVADDQDIEAALALDNVPNDVTAVVQPAGDGQPMRGLVTAPADPTERLDVDLRAAYTTGGTDCDDPLPTSPGDVTLACANVQIDDLPEAASFVVDATDTENLQVVAHACDLDVTGTGDCRAGTASEIGALAVDGRVWLGEPRGVGHHEPTEDQYVVGRADVVDADNLELRAAMRLEEIRSVEFRQTADGLQASTDLGTGVKPLEVHGEADLRSAALDDGYRLVGDVLVDPLPRTLSFEQTAPGADQSVEPMEITFETNEADTIDDVVDVDAAFELKEPEAADDDLCGAAHTACATVALDRLPRALDVEIAETEATDGEDMVSQLLAEVTTTQHAVQSGADDKTDLTVDATVGPDTFGLNAGTPLVDGKPLAAHLELNGLPTVVHARMTDRTVDDGTTTSTQLETVDVHTCAPDDPGLADDGTCDGGDELGEVVVNLRNFLKRPGNVPPPDPDTPVYVTLTGRGELFETEARLDSIRDVAYANHGDELGAAVGIGSGEDFSVVVDVKDFAIDSLGVGDLAVSPAVLDLDAEAVIRDLPTFASFCMRNGGLDTQDVVARGGLLSPCEDPDPFDDGAPLEHTPMTVAYRASNDITVETEAQLVVSGQSGGSPITPRTIRGVLDIVDIPAEITTHFLMPEDDGDGPEGPMRLLYDTTSPDAEQMDIHFEALMAVGDAICEDPRTTADSICARGDIVNLPSRVEVFLDPNAQEDNFFVRTPVEDAALELTNLLFASVKPTDDPDDADVMVIEGAIEGIPHEVTGSLHFPADSDDPPSVRVEADPPLGRIAGTFRNFIAPDPHPFPAPAQRAGLEEPTQTFSVFQRGEALKAEVEITDLVGGGYETLRDINGGATDTSVVSVDFGGNETVRAYADLMPDASTRTIGDVTIEDLPAGIDVCFRGAKTTTTPAAQPNFCDEADADSGAFQFHGQSIPDDDDNDFSVHAFVRQASSGGVDIVSGDVSVVGIPPIVQGTFPSDEGGDLDVGLFSNDGVTPNGVDEIRFNLATFDVTTHGYGADIPFEVRTETGGPFPVPTSTNQFASAGADLRGGGPGEFAVRGRLGDATAPIAPNSRLQRIRMLDEACAIPANQPDDYPHFPPIVAEDPGDPVAEDTSYQCIRVDLEEAGPDTVDPFDLHVDVLDDDTRLRLSDAGLTNLPSYVQMTIADTPTLEPDGAFRRRCGFHHESGFTGNRESEDAVDCMAPLLRFDQPDDAKLFGVLEYGAPGDITSLAGIQPREPLADLDESPDAASSSFWSGWGTDPEEVTGVRAKIGVFGEEDDARVAARVGVRLDIPKSLQVDQVQSWSGSDRSGQNQYWDASDLRFHFVVRDEAGQLVPRLGELTAMLHMATDGTQILLSQPRFDHDPATPSDDAGSYDTDGLDPKVGSVATPDTAGYTRGIDIPAEVGIDLYQRNHKGDGSSLLQIDGTLSEEFDLGARVLGGAGFAVGRAEAQVTDLPGRRDDFDQATDDLEEPSTRFRVHMLSNGASPPTGGGGSGGDDEDDSGGSDCSIFFCARTEIDFDEAFVALDFDPDDDNVGARQVDTVVNTRDGKQGVEVKAWDTIGGGNGDLTGISAHARIDIDPINVFVHAGIPLIGGADFVLLSDLQAGFSLDNVHNLQLRHNLLHMNVTSSGGPTTIGPIFYNIHLMHGSAYLLFVKLFGVDFIPPGFPPVLIGFRPCAFPLVHDGFYARTINGTDNFVVDPLADPRLFFSGVIGGPLNFVKSFITPFFCLTDVGSDDIPLVTSDVPGDPVGTTRAVGHGVPGTAFAGDDPFTPTEEPDLELPDYTLGSGTLALCGSHAFDELTIAAGATLEVATSTTDGSDTTGTGEDCPDDPDDPQVNRLSITAREITVNGTIDGAAAIQALGAGSGSFRGAGHGGAGGSGPGGGSGSTFGNTDLAAFETEPGARGAGGSGFGRGGQALLLNAELLDNNGTITVAGEDGRDRSGIGACDVFGDHDDDPGTPDVVVTENTGAPGWGAGSGGGLLIVATKVENSGTISADGGDGGDGKAGGGGGGGGGIVKLISPLYTGSLPTADGGDGGTNTCPGDEDPASDGGDGGDGPVLEDRGPQSQAQSPDAFWYAEDVDVPFSAAAEGGAAADTGITTVLCSVHIGTQAVQDAPDGTVLNELFEMPTEGPTLEHPCGFEDFGIIQVGLPPKATSVHDVDHVAFDPPDTVTTMNASSLDTGFEGFWTVAVVPQTPDNDCANPVDGPGGDFDIFNAYDDESDCLVEANPSEPDLVVGVDNEEPTLFVTSPGENTEGNDFEVTTSLIDLTVDAQDQVELSGIDRVECSNDGVTWDLATCRNGSNQWELTAGDGPRTVHVRAFDRAGNQAENVIQRDGVVDSTPPGLDDPELVNGVLGGDGWYRERPDVELSGYSDSGVGAGSAPYVYRFDGGADRTCTTEPSCTVDATELDDLVVGEHTIEVQAVDRLGNTSDPRSASFKVDDEAPRSALRTVPAGPDADGWYTTRPWIVVSAIDQVGASGVAEIRVDVDGEGDVAYDGPFQLGPGVHEVCFWAVDVAGNPPVAPAEPDCVGDIRVDDAAPAGSITFDGLAVPDPTGDDGWFDTVPDVVLSAFADDQGAPTAGGTFRYRVDNSHYLDCGDPCTVDTALLQTGRHLVHWTAVDRLGNQRADGTYAIDVDTEAPTTRIVLTPAPPGRGLNAWHWEQPWVVLDAIDQVGASGVASTTYTLDGDGPHPYTGPVRIPDGQHTICATSRDVAGNTEGRGNCVDLQVDTADPTTAATAPPPAGGDGWHLGPIATSVTSTDLTSGIDPAFDPDTADLCTAGRQDEDPTAPSGTCLSIDGGPFVVWDGAPLDLGEGVHRLRAFSQDVSGRRSAMVDETYRIDATAPVTSVRVVPAEGNDAGWWRRVPTMVLRADDGDPRATSATDQIEFRIDHGPWVPYERPVPLTDGVVDVDTRVRDVAGNLRVDPDAGTFPIDVHPPVVEPRDPSRLIWSRLLGPNTIELRWSVTEDLTETVRVGVIVHDVTGNVVRRLDAGVHEVTPGTTYHGSTTWDGKNQTLTGLVPLGVYYYRVVAVDEAGNVAHSRESRPITIKLL